jgi:His-Xaa-Ser system protein HxsD
MPDRTVPEEAMPHAGAETSFEIDERIYPLAAVQNAVYVFTDRAYVRIEPAGDGRLKVFMTFKPSTPAAAADGLKGEFDNELVHQALRLRVSESNQKIREFIVTKALVSAQPAALTEGARSPAPAEACAECASESPVSEGPSASTAPQAQIDEALEKEIDRLLAEIESGDGAADPLGVAVPWEEKFGGKAKADGKAEKPAGTKETAKASKSKPSPKPAKAKGGAKAKAR